MKKYVYKFTDIEDNIVKYIGIVYSDNRTLLQRIREHYLLDAWCNGKEWRIEYIELDKRIDCEGLEAHFISLYKTYEWYNKQKQNWGISDYYSKFDFEWKILKYTHKESSRGKRNVSETSLLGLCGSSVYIFNDGSYYNFFKSFKKAPIRIALGMDPICEEMLKEKGIPYMNSEMFKAVINKIDREHIPWGWNSLPCEQEQVEIEKGLKIQDCFTYKEKRRILRAMSNCKPYMEKVLSTYTLEDIKEYVTMYISLMEGYKDGKFNDGTILSLIMWHVDNEIEKNKIKEEKRNHKN